MKRRIAPVLSFLLVAGCSTSRPEPVTDVPIPAQWQAADQASAGAPIPSWNALFDDPALELLIREGLAANYNLEAAAARIDRAMAQARIAGADVHPQLSLSTDAGRRKQNFIGLPIPGAEDRVLSNTSTSFGAGLNVSWEADVWGRLRSARDAARFDAEAFALDYEAARLSLSGQIAKSWFATIEARQQLELAIRTRESRSITEDRIGRRYQEGLVASLDYRLARTNTAVAALVIERRRRQYDLAIRQLELLLGRYPAAQLEISSTLPEPATGISVGLPAEVIARRPDLRAALARASATGSRVAQARAALYPQFRLTGSAGTSTNELRDLLDGDFSVWSFFLSVVQPVFQGGRLRAGVSLAEAVEDESLASFAQQVLEAFSEVESSLFAQEALARQEASLVLAVENARAAQQTAEDRYAAGLVDYLIVLESQRQAFEAESQLLDSRRQRLVSIVDLHLALGGEPGSLETNQPVASNAAAKELK
ncbi:MAG TPA: efflux transporter outer membrane subunit [Thermoanaerobaculia bacterium]|nr:efflux transporter outer membrane subunit [Thermoanaerobaculia bacterium]